MAYALHLLLVQSPACSQRLVLRLRLACPQRPGYALHLVGPQRQLLPQRPACRSATYCRSIRDAHSAWYCGSAWHARSARDTRCTWWDRSARYGLRTWRDEIFRGESLFRPSLGAELRIEDGKGETDQASNEQGEDS